MKVQAYVAELIEDGPVVTGDDVVEDTYYQKIILNGIQDKVAKGHPIYQGTVTDAEKAKRRAKNKRARAARRNNRGS